MFKKTFGLITDYLPQGQACLQRGKHT